MCNDVVNNATTKNEIDKRTESMVQLIVDRNLYLQEVSAGVQQRTFGAAGTLDWSGSMLRGLPGQCTEPCKKCGRQRMG